MSDLVILGTDTGAGKTTFALLWLAAFADRYEYWKPLETGESDSAAIARLVPAAVVHSPMRSFTEPVAPLLAARRESDGRSIGSARKIARECPRPSGRNLLIETFGGPFSPLNDEELLFSLVRRLDRACVLVTSSAVGAIGRSLQSLRALASVEVKPAALVLMGDADAFAVEQVQRHWPDGKVWCMRVPLMWDVDGVAAAAERDRDTLTAIRSVLAGGDRPVPEREPPVASGWVERDRQAVWHPYTSLGDADPPLVCGGAQDEFLQLADGRKVIDAISSWWTILHGHRHPVLMSALRFASEWVDHVHFAGVTHAPAVELAELMLQTTPWPSGRVFFSDNGSTAVEVALKMAYQFWCHREEPERTRFVGFEGGYHGDTFGAMAVGREPLFFGRFEPLLFAASNVSLDGERLDAELTRYRGRVAAIIVEPLVQGAGGMRMHTPELLRQLADVAKRHEVLFIADEVMTGNRTGTRWAHSASGVAPDLICAGKTLAGGVLPLAATLVAPHIVEAFRTEDRSRTFFHGHSFTAHPLACAVGVANWKLPLPSAAPVEAFWRESLAPLRELPQVRDVRVCGTIAAVELAAAGGYLADVGRQLRRVCLDHGVLCRPLGNVLYALPPLLTSADSLARIADAMTAAVRSVAAARPNTL